MEAVAAMAGEGPSRRPPCASPVLTDWFTAWHDTLSVDQRRLLLCYAGPLTRSRGTTTDEVARQRLVLEWMAREAVPTCLVAAGLGLQAEALTDVVSGVVTFGSAALAPVADAVAKVAHDQSEAAWRAVAELAQPDPPQSGPRPPWRRPRGDADPRRVDAWAGLAGGVRFSAQRCAAMVVEPATAALRHDRGIGERPPAAWVALVAGLRAATEGIAWAGCHQLVSGAGWSWHTSQEDSWHAGCAAGTSALMPLAAHAESSAHDLVGRLLAVTSRRVAE
jgi:hypothetical protein